MLRESERKARWWRSNQAFLRASASGWSSYWLVERTLWYDLHRFLICFPFINWGSFFICGAPMKGKSYQESITSLLFLWTVDCCSNRYHNFSLRKRNKTRDAFPFFFEPPTFSFIWWPHGLLRDEQKLRPSMKRRMWGSKEKKGKGWPAGHQKSSWTSYQMKRKWWKRFSSSIRTHFDLTCGHLLAVFLNLLFDDGSMIAIIGELPSVIK